MIYQIDDHNSLSSTNPIHQLEDGMVLYLPNLKFELTSEETDFISNIQISKSAKNISYNHLTDTIKGADLDKQKHLRGMMARYQQFATSLVTTLFPQYEEQIEIAKTSYRPVEIFGRDISASKDDTRLHVDAFPSNPNGGKRILRVFNNINLDGEPRHWRLGEPFTDVVERFAPHVPTYYETWAQLQHKLGITKSLRTAYDHKMLHIHNDMKYNLPYQLKVPQTAFEFPPGSTWIVYTDVVSHAAMAGRQALEQTFNLPIEAMANPEKSPKQILEKFLQAG